MRALVKFKALLASLLLLSSLCCVYAKDQPYEKVVAPAPELSQKEYLYEIVRYLYLWHLTAQDYESIIKESKLVVWVAGCEYSLDQNDKSKFGKICFPRISLAVKVKKCDYFIKELNVDVQSKSFKVAGVEFADLPTRPEGFETVELDMKDLLDYLFRTRGQKLHPDEALFDRMRKAVVKEVGAEFLAKKRIGTPEEQTIFCSPLTPVSNEVWNYWVNGRLLIQFSSDIDLADPAVWDNESMMVKVYDLDTQVVLTMDEVPGSNRFITRTRAEHLLYNCVVLGQQIRMKDGKREAPAAPAAAKPE